jgi:hypothetical protein
LGISAQIYFVGTVVVMSIVLLNLFLALFFESFENPTKESDSDDQETLGMLQFQSKFFGFLIKVLNFIPPRIEKKFMLGAAIKNLEKYFNSTGDQTDEEDDQDFVM